MSEIHRIEVGIATKGGLRNAILQDLDISSVQKVEMIDVYTIEGGQLTADELEFLGREVFSDPIVEHFAVDQPLASPFDGAIVEVGFKPGVTDPVGITILQAVNDALNKSIAGAYNSRQYLLYGTDQATAERITRDLLANGLIERWQVQDGNN
ncbi:MAG TPA: phosphoribosylformylglycinamidine synthase subunit PurS, partial [Candidatus Lokiarchaeia archaeon]|nr:phosphoribosylformylglycinamidine synthase subunit PurS [Candidatus Lokiarchaeia archaeon]